MRKEIAEATEDLIALGLMGPSDNAAKGDEMTNWTPSEGLKRADAVVGEIEQAVDAGVAPSVLRHRLTEIVARAIDDAIGVKDVPRHVTLYTNGHHPVEAITITPTPGLATGDMVVVTKGPHEGTYAIGDQITPTKKARGRPKGSTKKKPKAQKEAPAVTAE